MHRKQLVIIAAMITATFIGFGIIIPIMPELPVVTHFHLNLMLAIYSAASFLMSPVWGSVSDRVGRRPVILTGLVGYTLSFLLLALSLDELWLIYVARLLGGLFSGAVISCAVAYVADITTDEERTKGMGVVGMSIGLGFIIGPGIGGMLADFGSRIPFFFAGGLGTLSGILSIILLTEPQRASLQHGRRAEQADQGRRGLRRIFAPHYVIVFVLIFIASFGLAAFESFFSLFVDHKFRFTPKDIAIIITGGAAFGAVAQVLLFDRLIRLWGEIRLIRYCLIMAAVLVFLMTVVHAYLWILLVTFLVFVGFDLFRPAATTYLANLAGDEQGFVGGMNSMFTSLANIFGPIVGGILFDVDVNYPYYLASITLVLGIVLTLFWRRPAQQTERRPVRG